MRYRSLRQAEHQIRIDVIVFGWESYSLEVLLGRIISIGSKIGQGKHGPDEASVQRSVNGACTDTHKQQLATTKLCEKGPLEQLMGAPAQTAEGVRQQSGSRD